MVKYRCLNKDLSLSVGFFSQYVGFILKQGFLQDTLSNFKFRDQAKKKKEKNAIPIETAKVKILGLTLFGLS